jgi:hypothetical protein
VVQRLDGYDSAYNECEAGGATSPALSVEASAPQEGEFITLITLITLIADVLVL